MDRNADSRRNEGIHRLWRNRPAWLSLRDSRGHAIEGPHERSLIHRLTYVATLLGIIAALVGAGYLAAWLGGYMSQRGLNAITMKTNAALCLTLVGAALILLVPVQTGHVRRWAARICAAVALLVGLLTFVENLAGWDFGIDQLLAVEAPGAMAVVNPNRMGMPASASFTLIGLALLILSRRDRQGTRVAQSLALAVCLIALLPTIGFLYGAEEFYGIARYTAIAWPTAVILLLMGMGLLCARPSEGLMAQITADDPGGVSVRRLLPFLVLLPLLLGWLRLAGERAGVFDAPTGTGMMMLLFVIIFSALTYHAGRGASRSAQVLRESEDRFRTMANAIPQLAWIARADGYIYWYNQRWYDYTGTTPAQMEGWGWQSVHDPQELPKVLARWKSSLATGAPFDMIFPLRGADGVFRPFLTRVMPLKDEQGRVQQWFGTNTDVSEQRKAQEERERLLHEVNVHAAQLQEANERLAAVNEELAASNEELRATTEELHSEIEDRKKAEQTLRESEERFRRYFELGLIGMAITSPAKGWIEVNDECCRLLGYGRDELVRKTWAELTYPDDLAADVTQFDRVLAGQIDGYTMDKRFVRKNGQVVDTTISVAAMRGAAGEVDYFVVLLQDITERKQAEEGVRESEKRFRTMADGSPNPIWVTDAAGERIFANKQYLEYFGISEREMERGEWKPLLHPDDALAYISSFMSALKEHRPFSAEARVRRADGQWRWIESHAEPRLSIKGELLGFVGMTHDITGRKEAEERLRDLNATLESKVAQRTAELQQRARQLQKLTLQLSQAEEQERRRIAMILHEDLQQQIAGAKFHLSLVRGRSKDDKLQRDVDAVDTMLKDAIEKSRSLSRDLSPAVLHMNDLTELLQWLANRMRAQQGLNVSVSCSGDMLLHSEALATFLFRASQEMLFNVVKHAHVREAAVRARRIRRCVCLSVSDQGHGFDPQRLKETAGLGLFSIRERVELLGGRMRVKSAKGKGSRLSITVPDGQPVVVPPSSGVNLLQPGAAGLPSNGALRVLLVDDHDVVRQGLAALLREAPGVELVGEAPDGREAVNLANELRPDVVIMDVSMPLMSGDEATRQIKTLLPQTRVIALSMYDEAEKKQKMFKAGAEGYILKTVSADELLAAIRGREANGGDV